MWLWVWDVRADGTCRCPLGAGCERAGKHPWWVRWEGGTAGWVRGTRQAVPDAAGEGVLSRPVAAVEAAAGAAGGPVAGEDSVLLWRGAVARSEARAARACGDSLVVLDFDGLPGLRSLLALWDALPWEREQVRAALTPRGLHVMLGPGSGPLVSWNPSLVGRVLRSAGLQGVDVKGRGGFVVWPGSSGPRRWVDGAELDALRQRWSRLWAGQVSATTLQTCPWDHPASVSDVLGFDAEGRPLPDPWRRRRIMRQAARTRWSRDDVVAGWLRLEGGVRRLRREVLGNRNALLNTLAYRLYQITAEAVGSGSGSDSGSGSSLDRRITDADVTERLRVTALGCGLSAGETDRTLRSAHEAVSRLLRGTGS